MLLGYVLLSQMMFNCTTTFMPYLLEHLEIDANLLWYGLGLRSLTEVPFLLLERYPVAPHRAAKAHGRRRRPAGHRADFIIFVSTPITVILVVLIGGLASGLYFSTTIEYAFRLAPSGLASSAQTFLGMATAIGMICSSLLGGFMVDTFGVLSFYTTSGLIIFTGFVLYVLFPFATKVPKIHSKIFCAGADPLLSGAAPAALFLSKIFLSIFETFCRLVRPLALQHRAGRVRLPCHHSGKKGPLCKDAVRRISAGPIEIKYEKTPPHRHYKYAGRRAGCFGVVRVWRGRRAHRAGGAGHRFPPNAFAYRRPYRNALCSSQVHRRFRHRARDFSDAVFIGDSRTVGLQQNGGLANAKFFCGTGLNVETAMTKPVVTLADGSKGTVVDALRQTPCQRVYVMFGVNELGWPSAGSFKKKYVELIQALARLSRRRRSMYNPSCQFQRRNPIAARCTSNPRSTTLTRRSCNGL